MDIRRHHFSGYYKTKCDKAKYNQIVDKIKQLDIFAYRANEPDFKTVVHKPTKYVSQDDLIGITSSFVYDTFFISNYDKVSLLDETNNNIILCISSCNESYIAGYYRFAIKYHDKTKTISMNYTKVQHPNTFGVYVIENLLEKLYMETNKQSITDTINYLLQENVMKTSDVIYYYK